MIRSRTRMLNQLSDIDIRLLRVFKAVVEQGGYSKAEIILNINRSTISIHMSDLEARLGIILCNRGRGRSIFTLTEEGKQVYQAILELFGHIGHFRDRVNAIQSQLSGNLRIALPDDILEIPYIDLETTLTHFHQQAPEVNIEILAHAPDEVDLDILNGQADVGINVVLTHKPGLEYKPLFKHTTGLYCGQKHPLFGIPADKLSLEQVVSYDLVGSGSRFCRDISLRYDLFKKPANANHMSGRCLLILSGAYLGFLPDYYAGPLIKQNKIKKIDLDELNYEVDNALIYCKNGVKKVLVDLFARELCAHLPQ